MVTGLLSQLSLYKNIHPNLSKAIEYILNQDLNSLSKGHYEIDGQEVFFMVNEYSTKPAEACEPEKHRKYTDIQIMLNGRERFGYTPFTGQTPATDFLLDNDVAFYGIPQNEIDYITLSPGRFIIFFPDDIHQPEVFDGAPAAVRKLVVKINMSV